MLRDPSLSGERSDFLFRNVGLSNRRSNHGSLLDAFEMLPFCWPKKVGALRLASPPCFFFSGWNPGIGFFWGSKCVRGFFLFDLS